MGCCLYECKCGWWGNSATCTQCGEEAFLMDWDEADQFNSDGSEKEYEEEEFDNEEEDE